MLQSKPAVYLHRDDHHNNLLHLREEVVVMVRKVLLIKIIVESILMLPSERTELIVEMDLVMVPYYLPFVDLVQVVDIIDREHSVVEILFSRNRVIGEGIVPTVTIVWPVTASVQDRAILV
jgi:hypothetical protein